MQKLTAVGSYRTFKIFGDTNKTYALEHYKISHYDFLAWIHNYILILSHPKHKIDSEFLPTFFKDLLNNSRASVHTVCSMLG